MTFSVVIQPSGRHFNVERGETVLDAALRQGIVLPYGCRNGACGNCKGRLLSGKLEPKDHSTPLSEDERDQGVVLLCRAIASSDISVEVTHIEEAGAVPIKKLPARITKMDQLAHDVMRLYLILPPNQRLQFFAGQYIQVIMRDGKRRSFSIANSPENDEFIELHIRNVEGGAFSEQVFYHLQEKAVLRIEGPYGQYSLREDSDRPLVFIAGGTGFAPIKGLIEHALAENIRRPMHLYWGVRALRDLYLDSLPRGWVEQYPHFSYTPVLSDPMPEDKWQGQAGYVHEIVQQDFADLSGFDVYASGPPVMVYAARDALVAQGLDVDHFYSDAFEYAKDG